MTRRAAKLHQGFEGSQRFGQIVGQGEAITGLIPARLQGLEQVRAFLGSPMAGTGRVWVRVMGKRCGLPPLVGGAHCPPTCLNLNCAPVSHER